MDLFYKIDHEVNPHILKEQFRKLLGNNANPQKETDGVRITGDYELTEETKKQLDELMASETVGQFPRDIVQSFDLPIDPLKICDGIEALIGKRPFYNYEGIKIRLLYFEKLTEEESKVVLNYLKGLWYDNRTGN
jgi:hypothetical protein